MWVKCEFSQVDKTCTGIVIIRLILMADALIFHRPSNVTSGAGSGPEVHEILSNNSPYYTYTMPNTASKICVGAYAIYMDRGIHNYVASTPIARAELLPGEKKLTPCSYYFAGNSRSMNITISFESNGHDVVFTTASAWFIRAVIYAFS